MSPATSQFSIRDPRSAIRNLVYACAITGLLCACSCIERTVTIRTVPDNALVFLNDEEVGRSPVTVPFTWYGDYDIVVRKAGYETLKTSHRIQTPWYELPGVDLFTECFVPWTVHDHHAPPAFALTPAHKSEKDDVILRAEEMRERALFTKQ